MKITPFTRMLLKIFVRAFYRAHSGMFLFTFVTLILYGFFIEVLNKTHLPHSEIILHHLVIVLTVISSPIVFVIVLFAWLVYMIKASQFVVKLMDADSNLFLFYSSTSISRSEQFRSAFLMYVMLMLPMIAYGCFALGAGIVFDTFLIPVALLIYAVLLAAAFAWNHVRNANSLRGLPHTFLNFGKLFKNAPKPFYSLYLYQVMNHEKTELAVTKIVSCSLFAGGVHLLAGQDAASVGGFISLGVAAAHSFMIYNSYRFERSALSFALNPPYSKTRIYFSLLTCYSVLLIPECLWLITTFELMDGLLSAALILTMLMVYKNFLYMISGDVKLFLRFVFYSFLFLFFAILLKLVLIVILLNAVLSILVLSRFYYKQRELIGLN